MDSSVNKLTLDISENPELSAALGGKEPGDRVKLEVTVMVTSVDDKTFEGTIEEISVDGEPATEVSSDEPVMAVMSKKAGAKEKPDVETPEEDVPGDEKE